jgi:hypothetical protein
MVSLSGICSIGKLFKSVGGAQSAAFAVPATQRANARDARGMQVPGMRMKERFMETSLAQFDRPLDPIIHRIHARAAAFIRADTQNR